MGLQMLLGQLTISYEWSNFVQVENESPIDLVRKIQRLLCRTLQ